MIPKLWAKSQDYMNLAWRLFTSCMSKARLKRYLYFKDIFQLFLRRFESDD